MVRADNETAQHHGHMNDKKIVVPLMESMSFDIAFLRSGSLGMLTCRTQFPYLLPALVQEQSAYACWTGASYCGKQLWISPSVVTVNAARLRE
jgi:hypothetical protein